MCEYISVIATSDGPLALYAAPGLSSHGDARVGWKITGGAEVEWTGKKHDSLTVRYADEAMARTIRAMIIERFSCRTDLIATIYETRGPGNYVCWYPRTLAEATKLLAGEQTVNLGLCNLHHELPAGLKTTGDLYLRGYDHELPAGLTTTGGLIGLAGYKHELPAGLKR